MDQLKVMKSKMESATFGEAKSRLDSSTITGYMNQMTTAARLFPEKNDIVEILRDCKAVIHRIENHITTHGNPYAYNSKKIFFTAVKSLAVKGIIDIGPECLAEYDKYMMKYAAQSDEHYDQNKADPKLAGLRYEQLVEGLNTLEGQDKLFMAMYVLIPPRRLEDYRKLEIVKGSDPVPAEGNYIQIPTATTKRVHIHIRDYKLKRVGPYTADLPDLLSLMVRNSVDATVTRVPSSSSKKKLLLRGKVLRKVPYLLVNGSGGELQTTNMTTLLQRLTAGIFGIEKGVSVSKLRHMYITEALENKKSLKERKKLAWAMGHSVAMQARYDEFVQDGDFESDEDESPVLDGGMDADDGDAPVMVDDAAPSGEASNPTVEAPRVAQRELDVSDFMKYLDLHNQLFGDESIMLRPSKIRRFVQAGPTA
jgi:hypothetical protein